MPEDGSEPIELATWPKRQEQQAWEIPSPRISGLEFGRGRWLTRAPPTSTKKGLNPIESTALVQPAERPAQKPLVAPVKRRTRPLLLGSRSHPPRNEAERGKNETPSPKTKPGSPRTHPSSSSHGRGVPPAAAEAARRPVVAAASAADARSGAFRLIFCPSPPPPTAATAAETNGAAATRGSSYVQEPRLVQRDERATQGSASRPFAYEAGIKNNHEK